jgi:hypothetical protein
MAAPTSVLFGFDSPPAMRVTPPVERQSGRDVISESYERTRTNRCNNIKSLQRENAKLKKDNAWLTEHCADLRIYQAKENTLMELKDKRNDELNNEVAVLRQQLSRETAHTADPWEGFDDHDAWRDPDVHVNVLEQNWDDWALNIQSNMSANKMITDVQQAILKNLAETMTGVKTRLEALEAKDRKDEAAFCLQSVAKDYLTNKRETAEWVVPEIGTG